MKASLYDTLDGSLLLTKRYMGTQGEWRRIVHKLADDILLAVTGEKGILSSRVLFVAGARNLKEVYTADFDGQGLKKMTNNRSITLSPSMSPGGKYLAYTSFKEGRSNLYVMDVEKNTEVYRGPLRRDENRVNLAEQINDRLCPYVRKDLYDFLI